LHKHLGNGFYAFSYGFELLQKVKNGVVLLLDATSILTSFE
jgi:hypothetical protein